jgi:hypothetical protein
MWRERSGAHHTRGWVDPQGRSGRVPEISLAPSTRTYAIGTHSVGGYVDPTAGLDVLEMSNPLPLTEIEYFIVQPVAYSLLRLRYPGSQNIRVPIKLSN